MRVAGLITVSLTAVLVVTGCGWLNDIIDTNAIESVMLKESQALEEESSALLAEVFAPDAVAVHRNGTTDPADDTTFTGVSEIISAYQSFWADSSNIQMEVVVTNIVVTGDTATCMKTGSGSRVVDATGATDTWTLIPEPWVLSAVDGNWMVTGAEWLSPQD